MEKVDITSMKEVENFLIESNLRNDLVELDTLKRRVKHLEEKIMSSKLFLINRMRDTQIKEIDLGDGYYVSLRKGSEQKRISLSDIEAYHPEILEKIQDIIKTVQVNPSVQIKYKPPID
ncbi:MAG: hypothetical protein INQ03_09270 [Candidatus Heimdallarchaeota archaeon]|nr:hypothetical protein [Candidatus Heimdallarchaeota archaeon]